jgi:hypothetical protein
MWGAHARNGEPIAHPSFFSGIWVFVLVVDYEVFMGVSAPMRIHGFCLACLLEPRLAVVFYGCRSMSLPFACSLFSGG